jgi:hypothetical protein
MEDSVRCTWERASVRKLRAIFVDIAVQRPEPLPHVARAGDGSTSSRGRNGDGHAGTTLLRGRIRPELAARARRVAREGGITLSAYMTALVTNRPVASTVAHGMSDDFLARVAASPVVQGLDDVERSLSDGACDVAALTTALRAIVAHIASDSGLTGEPHDEAIPEMFAVRVSSDVADQAKAAAGRCSFPSMVAYLEALIEHPCQDVPAVQPDTLAAGLPYTFAGSRVAAAVAHALRRVKAGEDDLRPLIPELRAVQRAIAAKHLARRADYDRTMDERYGARDDVGWSAGFIDLDE